MVRLITLTENMELNMKYFICEVCGNKFSVSYRISNGFIPRFCSKECRYLNASNKRYFKCIVCGKTFRPSYGLPKNKILNYCSKACAGRSKTYKGFKRYWSKSMLEADIKKLIKSKKKYLTFETIKKELSISSRIIYKFNISTIMCNKEVGFKQPFSMMEMLIEDFLIDELNLEGVVREKTFDDLLGVGARKLRYDFYIKNLNLLIELDDSSHYDITHKYYSEKHVKNDLIKDKYAYDNAITLLRIKYKTVKNDLTKVFDEITSYLNSL